MLSLISILFSVQILLSLINGFNQASFKYKNKLFLIIDDKTERRITPSINYEYVVDEGDKLVDAIYTIQTRKGRYNKLNKKEIIVSNKFAIDIPSGKIWIIHCKWTVLYINLVKIKYK